MKLFYFIFLVVFISCRNETSIRNPHVTDGLDDICEQLKNRPDLPLPIPYINRYLDQITEPVGKDYCPQCDKRKKIAQICQKRTPKNRENGSCDIAGTDSKWKKNCTAILKSGQVPPDAFKYALSVLKKNATSFNSNKCYKYGSKNHHSKASLKGKSKQQFENGYMKSGISNKCQMFINDLGNRKPSNKCMTRTYMIDICKKRVKPIYSFIGYGTCKKKYSTYGKYTNAPGKGTTLLGAFVSGPRFGYHDAKRRAGTLNSSYKGVVNYLKKRGINHIPAGALYGLNSTNNRSAVDVKYIHVSPYTSAGCNSIPKEYYKETVELIDNGPSLVVNYKKGSMEPIEKCSK